MYKNEEQRVHVSLSERTGVMKSKDNQKVWFVGDDQLYSIGSLWFRNISVPLNRLVDELKKGRCLGQVYREERYRRKRGFKAEREWVGTSWVGIDIDDSEVDMSTMCRELLHEPTVAMTTQSHLTSGHKNRYRLFYFFNQLMSNYQGFSHVADTLANDVRRVLNLHDDDRPKVLDKTWNQTSRFYFGSTSQAQVLASWLVYDPTEIYAKYSNTASSPLTAKQRKGRERTLKPEKVRHPEVWKRLHTACMNPQLDFAALTRRFYRFYSVRFQTQVDYPDDGRAFVLPPKNYMYLRFRWQNHTMPDGRRRAVIQRWHNHEHRRRILAVQLELVAFMHDFKLCVDELVYHALCLFDTAYCNDELNGKPCQGDDRITPQLVMDMARTIYQYNKRDVRRLVEAEIKRDECAYLVNRAECERQGLTPRQLLGQARHEFSQSKWDAYLDILMPYLNDGLSNKQLADILERETAQNGQPGVRLTPQTIGRHVSEWRSYRFSAEKGEKITRKGQKMAPHSSKIDFSACFSSFSSSQNAPKPTESSCSCGDPNRNNSGGILTKKHEIEPANQARMRNARQRSERFIALYNPARSDKENRTLLMQTLSISRSQYYALKRKVH